MTNPIMFLADLNGSLAYRDLAGTGSLTGSGAVRYQPAENARVNRVANGRVATALDNWWNNGSATISRVADEEFAGGYAIEVVCDGTNTYDGLIASYPNGIHPRGTAGTYTIAFDLKVVSGDGSGIGTGSNFFTAAPDYLGGTETPISGANGTVQRFVETFTVPATVAKLGVFFVGGDSLSTANAVTFRVSNICLFEGTPTDTSWFDGVFLDPITGILGTANASPSAERAVAWVEESTTNLVTNPWFATDNTGWSATNATIPRTTAYSYQGPGAGALTATGANATATISITAAASSHTAQWMLHNTHSAARTVQLKYNGSNIGSPVSIDPDETATLTAPFTGTGGAANLEAVVTDSANTEVMIVYYAGAEAKTYATSPCPAINASGTIQTGYAWTGSAHASTSTRDASSASVVTTSHIETDAGAIAFRYKRKIDTGAEETILTCGTDGAGTDYLKLGVTSGDKFFAEWKSNGAAAQRVTSTAANLAVDTEYFLYADWDGTTIRVSVDNGALDSDTRDAAQGSWGAGELVLTAA